MKRILIVDDSDKDHPCPIMSVWHACGGTGKACCEENCPLPKLPDKKELTGCADDYDNYYAGWNNCLDAITGGTP